jgi:hypothetical protein
LLRQPPLLFLLDNVLPVSPLPPPPLEFSLHLDVDVCDYACSHFFLLLSTILFFRLEDLKKVLFRHDNYVLWYYYIK